MPYRHKNFFPKHYYHLFNRGIKKSEIFFSDENYHYFLNLIEKYLQPDSVLMVCYCLMPNHFHFLIKCEDNPEVSKFMSDLFNAYVKAVNKQVNREGSLFGGRFKHVLVDKDEYLIHLMRYIHLNPLKAGLVKDLKDWPHSNYLEFINKRNRGLADLDTRDIYFASPREYEEFVKDLNVKLPDKFEKYNFD